jgi:hypothetical protein
VLEYDPNGENAIVLHQNEGLIHEIAISVSGLPGNFPSQVKTPEMLVRDALHSDVDFQGDDLWVATARGVSHGIRINTGDPK